jgi:hypothetical protein
MHATLAIKLLSSPTQLTMAERSKFMVGLEVENRGTEVVEPQLSQCQLLVNGKSSLSWGLAIGNGTRAPEWYKLPPGKHVTMSWPLGEALFETPGDYHLVLQLGGQESTADVHVAP